MWLKGDRSNEGLECEKVIGSSLAWNPIAGRLRQGADLWGEQQEKRSME